MQSQLEQFLDGAASRPYRKLVQHHMRRTSIRELLQAGAGEVKLLPHGLQPWATGYLDEANARFYDAEFWASGTCQEAFEAILTLAISVFPLGESFKTVEDAMKPENHDLAFQLFQIPTLNFAYSAGKNREQRRFMGIRKGIFG